MNRYEVNQVVRIKPFGLMSADEINFMDSERFMKNYCGCLARIECVHKYNHYGQDTYRYDISINISGDEKEYEYTYYTWLESMLVPANSSIKISRTRGDITEYLGY